MKSFKVIDKSKNMKKLIDKINEECLNRLKFGINMKGNNKGIVVSIESPKCCIDYAEFNVDRTVPLRQYFGKDIKLEPKFVKRWSYGVGSGNKTVGGDTITTKTREMTQVMKQFCDELNQNKQFQCKGKYCISDTQNDCPIQFNHVTILYYLMDSRNNNKIVLRPHCDLEVSAKNEVIKGNSQREGSPTVVLSLQCDKSIDFHQRFSNQTKFLDENTSNKVDTMQIKHGEFFVLHPDDERVFKRNTRSASTSKKRSSQFQHSVTTTIKKKKELESGDGYKLGISVCFRQSVVQRKYSRQFNIMINDETNKWNENDNNSSAMKKRNERIDNKRKELSLENNINRMNMKLNNFFLYAVEKT